MFKGRGLLTLIVLALILLIAYLLIRQGNFNLPGKKPTELPVDLKKIIPASWTLLASQSQPCDFDGDKEDEWLLLYSYDPTSVLDVYSASNKSVERRLIGGAIYDAQVNRIPQEPGNISPYRPALLAPYKLLPDFYTGKGQGFLGETDVVFRSYPPVQKNATNCQAEELYFLGYSYEPLPTRLSIFRWNSREVGYEGVHFVGNAHVDAPDTLNATQPITEVMTYNHLDNHRSLLCAVKRFQRPTGAKTLEFPEDTTQFTIDFCYGKPSDPIYPEAVLVALLRGGKPPAVGSPTGASFLTKNAELASELSALRTNTPPQLRILSLTNQGTVAPFPGMGRKCEANEVEFADDINWWCATEEAYVEAEVVIGDGIFRAVAYLISIANDQVTASVHWRVTSMTLQ